MAERLVTSLPFDTARLIDLWPIVDPVDAALAAPTDLGTDAPVLMLPVGLSARFSEDRRQLRVRIQPDTIHIDNHRYALTSDERRLGQEFWAAASTAREAAWHRLVTTLGTTPRAVNRAMWVANSTNPASPAVDQNEPSRRCLGMPDRWVVIAFNGSAVVAMVTSEPVSAELPVDAPRESTPLHEWLTSFPKAVEMGMAVTLDFAEPMAHLDLLLAVGVRSGISPDEAAAEIERMLAAHRYTDGLEFLPQGTPTNNTPQSRAAWRSDPDAAQCLGRELDPPSTIQGSNTDVLARALGVGAGGALRSLSAGDLLEQAHARAMLQALWPVTGGEFLEVLLTDNVGLGKMLPASVEAFARHHATSFVRARGPLPAVRVGRQPYGVLPVTSVQRWQPHGAEPGELAGLHIRLKSLWPFWEAAADALPRVGRLVTPSAHGATQVVAEILGQSPVPDPTGYLAWTVLPPYFSYSFDPGFFTSPVSGDLAGSLLGASWHPLITDTKLATERPASVVCPTADGDTAARLQALAEIAGDYDALKAFPAAPTDLVCQLVQRGLMRALDRDLKSFADELGVLVSDDLRLSATMLQSTLVGDLDAVSSRSFGALTVADIGISHDSIASDLALSTLILDPVLITALLPDGHVPAPEHGDAVEGIGVLAGLPVDQLTLLFGETIDVYSNRFDAWITSLATQRLNTLRDSRPAGVHIGGYGWLVNLEASSRVRVTDLPPDHSPDDDPIFDLIGDAGAVHAPSVQHAATAAVLRHADLGDRAEGLGLGDTERRFDLTSASARRARWLIEAMEAGQPLAAVLGYRVERLLQVLGESDVIAPLRQACPLVMGESVDHAENALTIPPHDVVDGLTLWRRLTGDLAADGLPPLPSVPASVLADLKFSVDAVADLLVVEGVHHIVGGDHARAQATLTGLAWGEAPSADLRSLNEMRDRLSIPVILAACVSDVTSGAGWNADRPRARVAPAAEAYAQRLLPPPAECIVTIERRDAAPVEITLAALGLCALDVVNDCPAVDHSGSLLEARFLAAAGSGATRRAAEVADGAPGLPGTRIGWRQLQAIGRRARTVLSAARPLTSADLLIEEQDSPSPSPAAADGAKVVRQAIAAELDALAPAVAAVRSVLDEVEAASHDDELSDSQLARLRSSLIALEPFGIARSVPLPGDDILECARVAADRASSAAALGVSLDAAGSRVIDGAPVPDGQADGSISRLAQIARTAFGDATLIAPHVDLPSVVGPRAAPSADELSDWIGELAEVRATTRSVHALWLGAEALGRSAPALIGMQYPLAVGKPGQPEPPDESWLGGFAGAPQAWNPPRHARKALVLDVLGPVAATIQGIVLDSWVEEIPLPDDEVTGLAININASDARPPQSWLLAVPPDPSQPSWRLGDLVAILTETLELARFRAAEPPADLPHRHLLPLVYVADGIEGTQPFTAIFTTVLASDAITRLSSAHTKVFSGDN